ncbi:MAG: hypothetical protein JXB07_14385, partial [Anaerolineae bacterium]|nr:hypothetical protein [Anaerolineae bacterium]
MKNAYQLEPFRKEVYQSTTKSADALMNVVDALSSQTNARSIAELSLEPAFQREYSSAYQAIDDFVEEGEKRQEKEENLLPRSCRRIRETPRRGGSQTRPIDRANPIRR